MQCNENEEKKVPFIFSIKKKRRLTPVVGQTEGMKSSSSEAHHRIYLVYGKIYKICILSPEGIEKKEEACSK